jgi:cell division protein FtsQ
VALYSVLAVISLGLALYTFYRVERFLMLDPRFALNGPETTAESTLSVSGARHASLRAVEAVFRDDSGRSVYLLPLEDRRLTLRSIAWVKDASVARLWPNRVLVRLEERKPVAFVVLSPSRFGLIDEDGVMLPRVADRFKLPVLAGVRASDPLASRHERVQRMLRLTAELGEAAAKFSEINVSDRDNLKVTEPYEGRMLTLLLGDRNFSLRYNNFVRHYDDIRRRLPDASTLDLRLEDRITVVE